ncbi:MAG: alpha/beta fold hydrolase [Kiloniellales bacterium]|jgi:3-oxoadipate enol-lactonase|nr:alpha/beta fold hydrolase [Kiloniellales bacterium]
MTAGGPRRGRIAGTAFEHAGEGPPVLLVHGLGLTRAMWDGPWPALAERFHVVRYDLLGHGQSDKPRDGYCLDRFAGQAADLMDGLGLARAAVVGFSLGGLIAQAFALARPERTAALAVLNAAHDRSDAERAAVRARAAQAARDGPEATVEAALARWFTDAYAAAHPETLARVRGWILANDPRVYPQAYRVLAEGDRELAAAVGAIRAPTLVMTGGEDRGNSPDMARRLAARVPGARLEIVPGLRHLGLMEDPEAFARPLIEFLDAALRSA